jgi:ribosomal protein S18 acetylase RimI-like enzyme
MTGSWVWLTWSGTSGVDRFRPGWFRNRGHVLQYPRANPREGYRHLVTTPSVSLRPITESEFAAWKDRAAASFAAGIGPARGLDPEEALKLAHDETSRLLPDGTGTEQHLIWIACDGSQPVGSLWISTKQRVPFVFGIEVGSEQRGKGYGRAIMLAGEEECRRLGYHQLDLNVFGDNSTAISLYESLGYTVTSQQMRKEL